MALGVPCMAAKWRNEINWRGILPLLQKEIIPRVNATIR